MSSARRTDPSLRTIGQGRGARALINVMASAALKAARGLIRDFGEVEQLQVSVKGPGDFVSTADLKAEKILRAELARRGRATAS